MAKHHKGEAAVAAKRKIVDAYARSGHLEIAAGAAGIGRATLDRWRAQDPEFEERLSRARFKKADEYLRELHTERDNKQRRWWLATQVPERFAARQHVELTGGGGGPIQITSLAAIVIADAAVESAYDIVLGALARANSDGEPRGTVVGGETRHADAVAALPASRGDRSGAAPGRKR